MHGHLTSITNMTVDKKSCNHLNQPHTNAPLIMLVCVT
jgi:hypothetical protein